MGNSTRNWQESEPILAHFGSKLETARKAYESFVNEGIAHGRRPELVGGGLIRSHGDWSQVVSLRKKGEAVSSDARVLGSSSFVDRILSEAEKRELETLRLHTCKSDLPTLLKKVSKNEQIEKTDIISGMRRRDVVRVRKLFCQIAVSKMGYSGAEVARFLGVSTSAVNRLAGLKELPECSRYVK